jgi:hypothetical protein
VVVVACLLSARLAGAQPTGEAGADDSLHVSFAGDVTATVAPEDDGFFNYTDYRLSLMRSVSATLVGALQFTPHFAVLGEVRLQNDVASAPGLYLRVRPWRTGGLAIQAGRIPPVFGRFSRRGYGGGNPLIGVPLAYHYLTTLRSSAVPASVDALLAVRGRGWRVLYPEFLADSDYGTEDAGPGLPLVSTLRWDTGVQLHVERERLTGTVALTTGSLSNPRVTDDNDGKHLAGRVTVQASPGVQLGLSLSRGAFLSRSVTGALPAGTPAGDYVQRALGIDGEVSAGYWIVRGEAIVSGWTLPRLGAAPLDDPLRATALSLEARYRVGPRWHVAARGERLLFSRVREAAGAGRPVPWDAPVSRVELGVGHSITRQLQLKVAWQQNWRDGVARPRPRHGFLAAQVAAWF